MRREACAGVFERVLESYASSSATLLGWASEGRGREESSGGCPPSNHSISQRWLFRPVPTPVPLSAVTAFLLPLPSTPTRRRRLLPLLTNSTLSSSGDGKQLTALAEVHWYPLTALLPLHCRSSHLLLDPFSRPPFPLFHFSFFPLDVHDLSTAPSSIALPALPPPP